MSATTSLFTRATKYLAGASDPGENRLTEVTAAVLERVPGLARHLAIAWLHPSHAALGETFRGVTASDQRALETLPEYAPVRVRTQLGVGGRFVDLELRFFDPDDGARLAAVVWVEIKHGITAHGGQLRAYSATRPQEPGGVVVVAPRATLPMPAEEQEGDVPERSWQATARRARTFEAAEAHQQWLLDEWLTYLKEEALMELDALGPEHLTALAYKQEAEAALVSICEEAAREIRQSHDEPGDEYRSRGGKPGYGLGYWSTIDLRAKDGGAWGARFLDWNCTVAHAAVPEVATGRIYFNAGLSSPKGAPPDGAWRTRVEEAMGVVAVSSHFQQWTGAYERCHRVALPQDVLTGTSLEAQGQSLGRWVSDAFAHLLAQGPPAAARMDAPLT